MATPYEEVYARFLPKIEDYSLLELEDYEIEEHLKTYLESSIVKFQRYCDKLEDRNNKQFNGTLTDEEKEILALLMCVEYLTPKLLTDKLMKQRLSSKEYNQYSQANYIKAIRAIKEEFQRDADRQMVLYTFKKSKMDDFK